MITPNHLESLGWTLIHFCWQAAAIALAYKFAELLVSRDTRSSSSHARYLLALVALLSMFIAAAGTFVYEEFGLQKSAIVLNDTHSVPSFELTEVDTTALSPSKLSTNLRTILPSTAAMLPWLDGLWMLGVFALSARTIGGWLLLQRLRSSATQQIPPELAASFTRLAQRIGVQGRVALRLSTRVASPLALGMVRSLILLPASALTTLSPEQLEAVLAHELAHIRRADYLWNILQTMIETLFFFHPAVWYVGNTLRQQRELCCDDIAIASCDDPLTYATALLALEEHRAQLFALHTASASLPLALALDGHQSPFNLRSRIARILGEPMQPTTAPRTLAPFSVLGVCAALALFAMPVPQVLASLRPPIPHLVPPTTATIATMKQAIPATPNDAAPMTAPWNPEVSETPHAPQPAAQSAEAINVPASPQPPATASTSPAAPVTPRSMPMPIQIPIPMSSAAPSPVATPMPAAAPAPIPRTSALGIEIIRALASATHVRVDYQGNNSYTVQYKNYPPYLVATAQAAATSTSTFTSSSTSSAAVKPDYVTQMRAAGYNEDIDQYIAMKVQGITPQYAGQIAQIGFGKPNAGELIALKIHGVTPEYLNELKSAGIKPESFQDVVSYRIFKVTSEFIAGMKSAGFTDLPAKKIVELRIQNITPEFARSSKQQFPDVTVNQLVQLRIFHIDDAFIAKAKSLGLTPITINKLVQLRTSGLIEDTSSNSYRRGTDPNADKAREDREKARDKAQLARDKAQEQAQDERDRARDQAQEARDKAREAADKL